MRAKKSFGQHFLQDQSVIKKIIAAANIQPGEVVVEIGPGHGVLTQALADAGAQVIAIEADRELIPELEERFGDRVRVIFSDVLKLDVATLPVLPPLTPFSYKLVSNLPYNIASAVVEKFLKEQPSPTCLVVMVQKEVADRMLAKPGEMSVLSVACQLYTDSKRVTPVSPGAFRPMPKVDSTVVRMDVKADQESNLESIIALAKIGFRSRRKQLHHNLAEAHLGTSVQMKSALRSLGLPETVRAQELTVEQWRKLWYTISAYGS